MFPCRPAEGHLPSWQSAPKTARRRPSSSPAERVASDMFHVCSLSHVRLHGVDRRHAHQREHHQPHGKHQQCEPHDISSKIFRHAKLRLPAPLVDVVHDRPAMSMRMRLLIGDLQAIGHEIQVVNVGEPHPRGSALRSHAVLAVPHGKLPLVVRIGNHRVGQRGVQMRVHRLVLVARVVAIARRVVQVVDFIGCSSPSPTRRVAATGVGRCLQLHPSATP